MFLISNHFKYGNNVSKKHFTRQNAKPLLAAGILAFFIFKGLMKETM